MNKIEASNSTYKYIKCDFLKECIEGDLSSKRIPYSNDTAYEKFAYLYDIDYEELMKILDGNINFNFYWLYVICYRLNLKLEQIIYEEFVYIEIPEIVRVN